METISYEYEGSLYVNLTNKCDCACVFCLRHNGHKGSIYADDLWLEHEPTRQEALDDLLSRDYSQYRELVFCGFGEPMYRTDDILWLVDELKKQVPNLPPVRINTNGHAGGVLRRHQAPGRGEGVGRHAGLRPQVPGVRPPRGDDHRGQGQDPGGRGAVPEALRRAGRHPAHPGVHPGLNRISQRASGLLAGRPLFWWHQRQPPAKPGVKK